MADLTPNPEGVDQLRQRLDELGATPIGENCDGAFRDETFRLGGVLLRLTSEYGNWRVTIAQTSGPYFPASFWVAALDGELAVPDPPASQEDVVQIADRLPELVQRASEVSPAVAVMGAHYSTSMTDRFT